MIRHHQLVCILLCCFATATVWANTKAPSITEILSYADTARGGGLPGLEWKVDVESVLKKGREETFTLKVSAASGNWVAEFQKPGNVFGNKLLKRGDNMWFTKRGLRKPVPISQRQRLTGSAANGDIASTNYVKDYKAERLPDETIDGEDYYVFDLEAKVSSVTYDRVKYWVGQTTQLGAKAEFYSSGGRLLKTATFEYKNSISVDGEALPFISRMVIEDAVNTSQHSVLEYDEIHIKAIPAGRFRL